MRMGIGLPAAVPGVDATTIGAWAAEAERAGFASVGVIDRLVYDNLEPLTAPAVAAARTKRVGRGGSASGPLNGGARRARSRGPLAAWVSAARSRASWWR